MAKYRGFLCSLLVLLCAPMLYAAPDRTQLAVWANEAIIATYTFDAQNLIEEQKQIAKYFSSAGWLAYTKALADSKLLDSVKKNNYTVTAVATHPPKLVTLDATHWQAIMPILVVYENPQYQQQQNLNITLGFSQAPSGLGVRGFFITSVQSKAISPPCQCSSDTKNDGG